MLGYKREARRSTPTVGSGSLDGLIRLALAERAGRAEPSAGAWTRLLLRVAAAGRAHRERAAIRQADAARLPAIILAGPGPANTGLRVNAYALTWRVPWGISLAALPLF